jgi:hypothetical protein
VGRADGGSRGDVLPVGLLTVMTTMSLNSTTCAQVRGQANNDDDNNTDCGPRSARQGVCGGLPPRTCRSLKSLLWTSLSGPSLMYLRCGCDRLAWGGAIQHV